MNSPSAAWPDLPYASWSETVATLQLWTQIVGKIRLSLTPWVNHSWHVPLYVSARGLGTGPIPAGSENFELEFDFISHSLRLRSSTGAERSLPLGAQTVAEFYSRLLGELRELDLTVTIDERPCEIPNAIPFSEDRRHHAYDPQAVHRFWRALIQVDRLFKLFRSGFVGKVSPVHFFWGAFDLAVTRFSGRRAPLHGGGVPGVAAAVMREAYSHEVSSAGFWPGGESFPMAAFYSYAYPEPAGYRESPVTTGAYYEPKLGEFILPYEKVRTAAEPERVVLDFLAATYVAAAERAHWDRAGLECALGAPGHVRPL
jgi:hypothetical protein